MARPLGILALIALAACGSSGGGSASSGSGSSGSGSASGSGSGSSGGSGSSSSGSSTGSTGSGEGNLIDGGQAFDVSSARARYARSDAGVPAHAAVKVEQTDLAPEQLTCGALDAGQPFHIALVETLAPADGGAVAATAYGFDLLDPAFDGGGYASYLVFAQPNLWPDGGGPRFIALHGSIRYDLLGASTVAGVYEGQLVEYAPLLAGQTVDAGYVTGAFQAPVCP